MKASDYYIDFEAYKVGQRSQSLGEGLCKKYSLYACENAENLDAWSLKPIETENAF